VGAEGFEEGEVKWEFFWWLAIWGGKAYTAPVLDKKL
jgi:hypothetical protein